MDFLRTELLPLTQAIHWVSFGHREISTQQYTELYNEYKECLKKINKHLNGKKHMVGDDFTIADIYLVLS